jgi:hypothetical protein
MTEGLPARVRDFLEAHVDSIELLEVLLMLAARPERAFTADEISDQLRTALPSAQNRLRHLHEHRLAERAEGAYRVRRDPELAETLRQVAEAYRERHVRVVTLIYSRRRNASP